MVLKTKYNAVCEHIHIYATPGNLNWLINVLCQVRTFKNKCTPLSTLTTILEKAVVFGFHCFIYFINRVIIRSGDSSSWPV